MRIKYKKNKFLGRYLPGRARPIKRRKPLRKGSYKRRYR